MKTATIIVTDTQDSDIIRDSYGVDPAAARSLGRFVAVLPSGLECAVGDSIVAQPGTTWHRANESRYEVKIASEVVECQIQRGVFVQDEDASDEGIRRIGSREASTRIAAVDVIRLHAGDGHPGTYWPGQ